MSHAEKVQQAKDALLDTLIGEADEHGGCGCLMCNAVAEYRALLAATCHWCNGTGSRLASCRGGEVAIDCPANCDKGRTR